MFDHEDLSAEAKKKAEAIAAMADVIKRRCEKSYAPEVAKHLDKVGTGVTHPDEEQLLDSMNTYVELLIDVYVRARISAMGDRTVFEQIYLTAAEEWKNVAAEPDLPNVEKLKPLLSALLAAEVELRGPRRLSRTQSARLARVYESLGQGLLTMGLAAHAALAYLRGTELHRQKEDFAGQDRCGLALARARRQAVFPRWRRLPGWLSDLLCGYGFRPFWLLGWMAALLLIFAAGLWSTTSLPLSSAIHMVLVNFLNPVGFGDLDDVNTTGRILLIIESYSGIVLISVFFALLVRRWFRL
ncbi:potassium channel family protein [Nocardia sp. NPDC048505]|uniref:potassium channel family protein n=1 Tax=unclassified Nocardia TaxID=2637762 RepID=UPI0033C113AD